MRHKVKISNADDVVLSCVMLLSLFCSRAIISSTAPVGKSSHLGCGAGGLQVGPEQGGGQDRTEDQGTKACPCMGRHLTGVAEASSAVLSMRMASYQWGQRSSQIQGT